MNAAKTTIFLLAAVSILSACERVDGMGYAERAGQKMDMAAHDAMKKIDKIGGAMDRFGPTKAAQAAEIEKPVDLLAIDDGDDDDDDMPTTTGARIGRELDDMVSEITTLAYSASSQLDGAIRNLQETRNK